LIFGPISACQTPELSEPYDDLLANLI
jgi:hypothetical protein